MKGGGLANGKDDRKRNFRLRRHKTTIRGAPFQMQTDLGGGTTVGQENRSGIEVPKSR